MSGDMKREHAQEFSESLDRIGEGWYRQAVLADALGVPKALGLSWIEWTDKYMPRLKLAAKQRREIVESRLYKLRGRQLPQITRELIEKMQAEEVAQPRRE